MLSIAFVKFRSDLSSLENRVSNSSSFLVLKEFEAKNLEVRAEFDTFGSTAAEYARRQAAKEIGDRYQV